MLRGCFFYRLTDWSKRLKTLPAVQGQATWISEKNSHEQDKLRMQKPIKKIQVNSLLKHQNLSQLFRGVRQSLRQQGVDFDPSVNGSWAFHGADYESLCSILRVPYDMGKGEERWTWIWMNMISFGIEMSPSTSFNGVFCWWIVSFAVFFAVVFLGLLTCTCTVWYESYMSRAASVS